MIWKLQDRGFFSEIYIHASVIIIRQFSRDDSCALTVCGQHPSDNPSTHVEHALDLISIDVGPCDCPHQWSELDRSSTNPFVARSKSQAHARRETINVIHCFLFFVPVFEAFVCKLSLRGVTRKPSLFIRSSSRQM